MPNRRSTDPSAPPAAGDDPGITVGVTGRPIRATVSSCGDVAPWTARRAGRAGTPPVLSWYVAADDRWHVPATDPTVRQRRVEGTPVVETRLRVPDGDAVQRVWSVADRGGLTVVEVENDSPLPFAVAFAGAPVLTQRPPADVPIRGIDLPAGAVVLPVGHHTSVRVALAPDGGAGGPLPPIPDAATVVRGWRATTGRASRLELPDPALVDAVTAARCDLLLEGPVDGGSDPIGFLLDVGELVRLGDDPRHWLPEIVGPAEAIARGSARGAAAGLLAAGRVAAAADDVRAIGDIERILARRDDTGPAPPASFAELERGASAGRFVFAVESLLASGGALLPSGLPTAWLGHDWSAGGIPTAIGSTVSYALRWHGDRPAVLWEQDGTSQPLTAPVMAPGWSCADRAGEALWPAPVARPGLRVRSG